MLTELSSPVVMLWGAATGGSFTGNTVMPTEATLEDANPSEAEKVKLSDPEKSCAGV
jgi:hypothetical protein